MGWTDQAAFAVLVTSVQEDRTQSDLLTWPVVQVTSVLLEAQTRLVVHQGHIRPTGDRVFVTRVHQDSSAKHSVNFFFCPYGYHPETASFLVCARLCVCVRNITMILLLLGNVHCHYKSENSSKIVQTCSSSSTFELLGYHFLTVLLC